MAYDSYMDEKKKLNDKINYTKTAIIAFEQHEMYSLANKIRDELERLEKELVKLNEMQ